MVQKHSRLTVEGRLVWFVDRLWYLARDLSVRKVLLDKIAEFDQNCWFGPTSPSTCRAVAEHARRIIDADLRYPIILSAEGYLMDGGHRLAKAYLLGLVHLWCCTCLNVCPQRDLFKLCFPIMC